ncbi:MAG: threonine synthase [Sclerophora amabilis]|nr:MAG: threonine synthase [Sclerophora amabilis]
MAYTASQRYLSTRGGTYDLGFEEVVLRGLASDGGLFVPEEIPQLPSDWVAQWQDHSFSELAYEILSLYISPSEIPPADLKDIIARSYSTFRTPDVTPLIRLDEKLYLLELFFGPTYAFKDVALQFLGNLFEYFLVRRNKDATGKERHRLTVVGATSGDTGSAAIYGLRRKKDVSVFILHPKNKVSPIQEAQMTTVLDANVHNLAVEGSFDDCQDTVKALFADPEINKTQKLAAVNSINWARILAQMTYYFHAFFSLRQSEGFKSKAGTKIRFVVPTGNFGDILAGWFAKRMGLEIDRLVVATNSNDILDRFWKTGHYEKKPVHGREAQGGLSEDGSQAHEDGVKETLSPAMDILVSSNFERLLWYLAYTVYEDAGASTATNRQNAGKKVLSWLTELKSNGGFGVDSKILAAANSEFESERVSDDETIQTIKSTYSRPTPTNTSATSLPSKGTRIDGSYVLDPHTAVGITASHRSMSRAPEAHHVALATAHPAKFSHAVDLALRGERGYSFSEVLPEDFIGLEQRERRVISVPRDAGLAGVRKIICDEVDKEMNGNGSR